MLTHEDLEKIVTDLVMTPSQPPRVTGEEADACRKSIQKDYDEAKKNGWILDVSHEILPDVEDPDDPFNMKKQGDKDDKKSG